MLSLMCWQALELDSEEARRWAPFINFKRRVDRRTVMSGRSILKDLRPGSYDLAAMVDFADLPPLLPRHAVVKNCYWIDGSDGAKVGSETTILIRSGMIYPDPAKNS